MSTTGESTPPASATNLLIVSGFSPPPSTTSAPVAGPTLGASLPKTSNNEITRCSNHNSLRKSGSSLTFVSRVLAYRTISLRCKSAYMNRHLFEALRNNQASPGALYLAS